MSQNFDDLSQLSRDELYLIINTLKRDINCLSTHLQAIESQNTSRVNQRFASIGCQTSDEWVYAMTTTRHGHQLSAINENTSHRRDSRRSGHHLMDTNAQKSATNDAMSGRLYECSLDGCDHQKFNKKDALTRHQLRRHPNELPDIPWIACAEPGCQYRSKCSFYMTRHMKRHPHFHVCPHTGCRFKTKYEYSLDRHLKTCKAGEPGSSGQKLQTIGNTSKNTTEGMSESNDRQMDCDINRGFGHKTSGDLID
ncbi:unnamed protein product [Oppiella nova]|uniref:C2H2-type domain-containing protein n=1 Tax=Oppiella nova TaxID=334625 RepID=A0A7R9M064_9ACAR|nr:unnamed protein product [Oppiella nova]CAG2168662.1 unnamed protein product [Oppiella nova]